VVKASPKTETKATPADYKAPVDRSMKGPNGEQVMTGPRGGKYYINKNGNKTYLSSLKD
jgi:colicin import membrane protein